MRAVTLLLGLASIPFLSAAPTTDDANVDFVAGDATAFIPAELTEELWDLRTDPDNVGKNLKRNDEDLEKRFYRVGGCLDWPSGTSSAVKTAYYNDMLEAANVAASKNTVFRVEASQSLVWNYKSMRLLIRNQNRCLVRWGAWQDIHRAFTDIWNSCPNRANGWAFLNMGKDEDLVALITWNGIAAPGYTVTCSTTPDPGT